MSDERQAPETTKMNKGLQTVVLALVGLLWVGGIGAGYRKVWTYQSTAGAAAKAPKEWPAGERFVRNANGPTLVMLAHPHCPCTRASLAELSKLVSAYPEIRPYIFILQPEGFKDEWAKTAIWKTANHIPGARVFIDAKGVEAARFGARTSGQVVVYDGNGKLTFSGGITASRGHQGEAVSQDIILALFKGEKVDQAQSPVFGCSLKDEPQQGRL